MRTLEDIFDLEKLEFKVSLKDLTIAEKDVVVNGLFFHLRDTKGKLNALTYKFTGVTPLDFTIISQPDFQITFFGKAEEEPLDQEQYVYIEGYLNHKKVESRRFLVSDIEQLDKEQKEKSVSNTELNVDSSPFDIDELESHSDD